jgi:hypothetical protein
VELAAVCPAFLLHAAEDQHFRCHGEWLLFRVLIIKIVGEQDRCDEESEEFKGNYQGLSLSRNNESTGDN